jgi:hypothetical protein
MGTIIMTLLVICTIWYVFCPERAPLPVLLVGNAICSILAMNVIGWVFGGIWRGVAWVFGGIGSLLKGALALAFA